MGTARAERGSWGNLMRGAWQALAAKRRRRPHLPIKTTADQWTPCSFASTSLFAVLLRKSSLQEVHPGFLVFSRLLQDHENYEDHHR